LNKPLSKLIALLLVPALTADPVTASALMSTPSPHGWMAGATQPGFASQALAVRPLSCPLRHPTFWSVMLSASMILAAHYPQGFAPLVHGILGLGAGLKSAALIAAPLKPKPRQHQVRIVVRGGWWAPASFKRVFRSSGVTVEEALKNAKKKSIPRWRFLHWFLYTPDGHWNPRLLFRALTNGRRRIDLQTPLDGIKTFEVSVPRERIDTIPSQSRPGADQSA
jgi:hypothetical protein